MLHVQLAAQWVKASTVLLVCLSVLCRKYKWRQHDKNHILSLFCLLLHY